VWTHEGESHAFGVADIDWIGFAGDSLRIVDTFGTHGFAVEAIRKIDFLWDPTGIGDPRETSTLVKVLHLFPNQPNPCAHGTEISFRVPRPGRVLLRLYSIDGRLVRTLIDEVRPSGVQAVRWDGKDDAGQKAASGVYCYRLTAGGVEESRRLVLLR
jgi:hypothetical protein